MAESMTMNGVIHAAVRRDFERLDAALERASDGDVARAGRLERAYANLHDQLTYHHESEDRLIFPFVTEHAPAPDLLSAMDREHHAMAEALGATRKVMSAYASSGSADDRRQVRDSLARTRAVVDEHLAHEEAELEPVILRRAESKEWKAVEKQLRPKSPTETGDFLAWIQDGMTAEHRAVLRSNIPPPIVFLFSRLGGRSYRREVAPVWAAD